jgi:hypothetical protein
MLPFIDQCFAGRNSQPLPDAPDPFDVLIG